MNCIDTITDSKDTNIAIHISHLSVSLSKDSQKDDPEIDRRNNQDYIKDRSVPRDGFVGKDHLFFFIHSIQPIEIVLDSTSREYIRKSNILA